MRLAESGASDETRAAVAGIITLEESMVVPAAQMLARAFQDDPVHGYVFPDARQRASTFPAVFAPFLRYGLRAGLVLATESLDGVAVWLPPEHRAIQPDIKTEAGLDALPTVMGLIAANRLLGFIAHLEALHRQEISEPHWYLMVLGVEPSARRRGVGSALLRSVLDRADTGGHACYLETAQPANVRFYERHGFVNLGERIEPQSGLRFWPFLRSRSASP